jgi:hypothetical protein
VGHERKGCRWLDLDVGAKGCEQRREGWGIGVLDLEGLEDEPLWR